MNARTLLRSITAAAITLAVALPLQAQRGTADFTRYVALGDSFGAGVSNSSLVQSHQNFSYPAIIARQAGAASFQQPLVSQPGIPPELRLNSLAPLVIAPKATTNGTPLNLALPRPYDNLSIPGARAGDLITLTGAEPPTSTARSYAQFILRGLGTPADQAIALKPTFITVWIGGNDVLGAVLSGTPAAMTPLATFRNQYEALLDRLVAGAPNAGMVVGGVAPVTALPFATTIPPVIINPATGAPVIGPDGKPLFYIAERGDGTVGFLTAGSLVLLSASEFLGQGFGVPAALGGNGKPLPDAVVLDAAEVQEIAARSIAVNDVIRQAAAARNIPMVDFLQPLQRWIDGIDIAGVRLSTAFLTGGLLSYDGFHPTGIGYTLLANEFIRTINAAYGSKIPLASITPFMGRSMRANAIAGDLHPFVYPGAEFIYTIEAWRTLLEVTGQDRTVAIPDDGSTVDR